MNEDEPRPEPGVGLCSLCHFGARQESSRGQRFWRCRRAESDPDYPRYPRLPVPRCPGFTRQAAQRD